MINVTLPVTKFILWRVIEVAHNSNNIPKPKSVKAIVSGNNQFIAFSQPHLEKNLHYASNILNLKLGGNE